jgi:hypothetical protein
VTVGLPSENKVFIEELKKITKKESAGRTNAKGGRGRA